MKTFDALDRKIFAALDSQGRISVSDLARKVRHGRDIAAYRVRRAEKSGILNGAEPLINPGKLGLGLYKTYVSFAQTDDSIGEIDKRLRSHPSVYCAARAHGRWDLIFNAVAKSPTHFMELRNELFCGHDSNIREIGFSIITHMVYFNRKYLKSSQKTWETMCQPSTNELDPSDRAILVQLAIDARRTDVELAKAAGLSKSSFRYRLEQLENSGVIEGYRARFDRTAFDLSSYKLHINLRDYSQATLDLIQTFAKNHEYVTQFMTQLGMWSCELNTEAFDNRHLTDIIENLRDELGSRIGHVEVSLYDKDDFTWGFGASKSYQNTAVLSAA